MGIVTSSEGSLIDGAEEVAVEILVMMTLGFDFISPLSFGLP